MRGSPEAASSTPYPRRSSAITPRASVGSAANSDDGLEILFPPRTQQATRYRQYLNVRLAEAGLPPSGTPSNLSLPFSDSPPQPQSLTYAQVLSPTRPAPTVAQGSPPPAWVPNLYVTPGKLQAKINIEANETWVFTRENKASWDGYDSNLDKSENEADKDSDAPPPDEALEMAANKEATQMRMRDSFRRADIKEHEHCLREDTAAEERGYLILLSRAQASHTAAGGHAGIKAAGCEADRHIIAPAPLTQQATDGAMSGSTSAAAPVMLYLVARPADLLSSGRKLPSAPPGPTRSGFVSDLEDMSREHGGLPAVAVNVLREQSYDSSGAGNSSPHEGPRGIMGDGGATSAGVLDEVAVGHGRNLPAASWAPANQNQGHAD